MLKKIVDEIYQLTMPIPYDFGEVNCYLIKGENGFTIVDTGAWTQETKEIWKKILSEYRAEKILITHSHPDHIGLAGWLQQKYDIPVWLSKKGHDEISYIRSQYVNETYTSPMKDIIRLHGGPVVPEGEAEDNYYIYESYHFEPNEIFEENNKIQLGNYNYEAIWTPGHSPDHICYYNKENEILIVGDHILSSMNPVIIAKNIDDNPLKDYLNTFDKLIDYKVKHVLTGHGEQIQDLKARIKNLKAHYQKRWKQILAAVQDDHLNAFEITKKVYGQDIPIIRLMTYFMQTITNLNYLESEGFVKKEKMNGVFVYSVK